MSLSAYLAFFVACVVLMIVPGPAVTMIIANSLRHGRRAGLLNVAGVQLGLALTLVVLLLGFASVVSAMGEWFVWLRLAGAVYLVWIGCKLLWASAAADPAMPASAPRGGFFLQGLAVSLSNPKTLLFFGAFLPQFMDPARSFALQALILGATAMVIAAITDSSYAVLASRAGVALSRRRVRWLTRASGGMLIGGGIWLAFSRTR
jgi:threonine/homoserine/homoserine lactone efflux protein